MNEHRRQLPPGGGENLPARPEVIEGQGWPAGYGYPPEPVMEEEEGPGLLEYWRMLRRRRGTLILITALGLLIGILVTVPQTPVYQAKTTLEILAMNENFMNMKDVQQVADSSAYNVLTDIQTQIKILQSETLVDKVMEGVRGEKGKEVDEEKGAGTGRISAWRRALNLPEEKEVDQRQALLKAAAKSLKAKASGQTRIIEVTVDSPDKNLATDFANRLTQEFIEQNMEARWKMSQRTGDFLGKQLDDMRVKLERSEDALQQYARQHGLLFTGTAGEKGGKTNVSEEKLSQLQTELTRAQTERVQKQSRWEMASTAPADSLPDVLNDQSLQGYQTKLADLQRDAADLEETYTANHPKVKRVQAQIRTVQRSLERQRSDILRRIRNEYDEALRRERLLTADFQRQTGLVTDQGEKAIQYNILQREAETNRQLYENMLQRVKEASVASALRASNIRVVDPAKLPKRPVRPVLWLNAMLGLMGGVFLAVAYIVMTEKADRTLQDPADVGFYLGVPELGMIPSDTAGVRRGLYYGRRRKRLEEASPEHVQHLALVTYERKPSLLAESFRAALTSILFAGQNGHKPRVLTVTSPSPGEGKTTVAANLAIAMAETGQKVLIIDADTRKPRMHEIFEMGNEEGLTTLLQGVKGEGEGGAGENGLVRGTKVPNLFVITSGPTVAGPTNLLYSRRLRENLARFEEEFDMVFIDTPPMLQIPDARVIGKLSNGVILVVRAGQTTRDAAVAARARLREDGIAVIGTIMNDWNPKRSPGGYYGYYDGYHRYYRRYYGYHEHEG
jgi:succinoglycan biosynthesis transport protein ExoP